MSAPAARRKLSTILAVAIPIVLLIVTIVAVWFDWQAGAGEIGFHGLIALAGAGLFSLGLTLVLVWLMIRSHRTGQDARTGLPDDETDLHRRGS